MSIKNFQDLQEELAIVLSYKEQIKANQELCTEKIKELSKQFDIPVNALRKVINILGQSSEKRSETLNDIDYIVSLVEKIGTAIIK